MRRRHDVGLGNAAVAVAPVQQVVLSLEFALKYTGGQSEKHQGRPKSLWEETAVTD